MTRIALVGATDWPDVHLARRAPAVLLPEAELVQLPAGTDPTSDVDGLWLLAPPLTADARVHDTTTARAPDRGLPLVGPVASDGAGASPFVAAVPGSRLAAITGDTAPVALPPVPAGGRPARDYLTAPGTVWFTEAHRGPDAATVSAGGTPFVTLSDFPLATTAGIHPLLPAFATAVREHAAARTLAPSVPYGQGIGHRPPIVAGPGSPFAPLPDDEPRSYLHQMRTARYRWWRPLLALAAGLGTFPGHLALPQHRLARARPVDARDHGHRRRRPGRPGDDADRQPHARRPHPRHPRGHPGRALATDGQGLVRGGPHPVALAGAGHARDDPGLGRLPRCCPGPLGRAALGPTRALGLAAPHHGAHHSPAGRRRGGRLPRGLMQGVGAWIKRPVLALVVSTVLSAATFAPAHTSLDPWVLLDLAGMAAACCYLTRRTGGLEAAIVLHVVNNMVITIGLTLLGGIQGRLCHRPDDEHGGHGRPERRRDRDHDGGPAVARPPLRHRPQGLRRPGALGPVPTTQR
uniref:CPBP family glutamic-type intramembrane protease n=1 Tax=Janibacter limosus TaxID=53458 RepID=A0AC61U5W5_9MICO|nr:CPBP family glutamic-type intramembrane protease [Janibacter limosus]